MPLLTNQEWICEFAAFCELVARIVRRLHSKQSAPNMYDVVARYFLIWTHNILVLCEIGFLILNSCPSSVANFPETEKTELKTRAQGWWAKVGNFDTRGSRRGSRQHSCVTAFCECHEKITWRALPVGCEFWYCSLSVLHWYIHWRWSTWLPFHFPSTFSNELRRPVKTYSSHSLATWAA